jgi:cytochrome P450
MRRLLGDVFKVTAPGFSPIFVAGPEANRQVLVRERHKLKWRSESDAVTKLLRHGLLVEDDEEHDALRACMDPPLQKRKAIENIGLMRDEVAYVCEQWESGSVYDMLVEMRKVSLLVLMRASFHWDFRDDMDRLWKPILTSIKYISPGPWLIWPDLPRLGFEADLRMLDEYLYHMIQHRRRDLAGSGGQPDPSDLLGALVASGIEDGLIRDQLLTMLIAGHDTSTALLSWALYLLGRHPDKLSMAREEVDTVLGGEPIGADHLSDLQYLDWVSKEALRLFPPIHVGNRQTREKMVVKGCPIQAGSRLMYSIYLTHRHPAQWEDPDEFEPERFRPGGPKRESLSFVPFGGGPRNCIGAAFAQVQAKVVLSHILAAFDLTLREKTVRPYMGATLEPRPGVRMLVSRRD